jgi:Response regulator containing a CheY-like receiver domain and an HTH DNA-binding domain
MRSVTVFVVDDHRMVATGLASVLMENSGIDVVGSAGTAHDAMVGVAALQPDVALVDLRLPDADGVELATRLREVAPGLQIALISASFTRQAVADALSGGVKAFVSKLASAEELVQAVRAAAAGSASVSSDVVPLLTADRSADNKLGKELSVREREVLQGLADGASVVRIAGELHLSQHTVRNHIRRAMSNLGVHRRLDAVVAAARLGVIDLPEHA